MTDINELTALLRSLHPAYGAVGSRDVDVARQQKQIDAAIAQLEQAKAVGAGPVVGMDKRVFVLPTSVAKIIDGAFLPTNPNKLRKAHPDVVAAAKIYKEALSAHIAAIALQAGEQS